MNPILLTTTTEAEKVITFLYSLNAFHWSLSKAERKSIHERVEKSLEPNELTRYWYFKTFAEEVIGVGALEQLPDTEGGYFLGWFAIHKDYRNQGLGRKIINQVETYARDKGGRFITIDTGADNPAQTFYEKVGYTKVGVIPEYFADNVAKVIYYKKL